MEADSVTLSLIAGAVVLLAYYVHKYAYGRFNYWKKFGIPQVKVQYPFIGDTLFEFFNNHPTVVHKGYYAFPNERFYGAYNNFSPVLIVRDPELVEHILIKDFSQMTDRGSIFDPAIQKEQMQKHLLNLKGEPWKHMRNKLAPTFTSGKLKSMHFQLVDCADILMDYMTKFEDGRPLEVRDVATRFTMDVIASCAFGLSIDTINSPDSPFRMIGLRIFSPSYKMKAVVTLGGVLPRWVIHLIQNGLSNPFLRKKLSEGEKPNFFKDAIDQTIDYRVKNNVSRADFLQLMYQLKLADDAAVERKEVDPNSMLVFDWDALRSNAFVFFIAGFETTATTMSYMMYELAMNPDVQEKVYQEVSTVLAKYGGVPTYEAAQEMVYLEQCMLETLRKYPPVPMLIRVLESEYRIPGTDIIVPSGTRIAIPSYALQHDSQYFPDPEKFMPERFDAEKDSVRKGTYNPFGGGPRICIGSRFAKLEVKVCISKMLNNFQLFKCDKTRESIVIDKRSFALAPEDGVWISLRRRAQKQ